MNMRMKVLLGIAAVIVGWIGFGKLAPKFDYSSKIEEAEIQLASLNRDWQRHAKDIETFAEYYQRSGGADSNKVKNDLLARANELLSKHRLKGSVTARSPKTDRKTLVDEFGVTVNAEGPLESVVRFLVGCEEIPQLVRVDEVHISPATISSRDKDKDRFNLMCKIDAIVPPAAVVAPAMVKLAEEQPEAVVRHMGDAEQYALIWERTPFTEWQKPKPPPRDPPERDREPVIHKVKEPLKQQRDTKATITMVAVYGHEGHMVHEVYVQPGGRGKHNEITYTLGDKMDEGKIVLVHPLGVVVRKKDGDHFYATGSEFGDSVRLAVANDYPQVQAYMRHLREQQRNASASDVEDEPQALEDAERDSDGSEDGTQARHTLEGGAAQPEREIGLHEHEKQDDASRPT